MVPVKPPSLAPDAPIREAVRLIEESRRGIATVVDDEGRILGTLTDGDIRRLILRGGGLDSPVAEAMNRTPVTAPAGTPDHSLAALLRDRGLEALPLLDEAGRLSGIAHIRDLLPKARGRGGAEGFVAAIVMAGGEGTRLRPITEAIPKSMVEVGGMPLVERHVRHLARAGVRRVFIAVNYLAHCIEAHFASRPTPGIAIEYLREDCNLGTAGALSLLPSLPPGPVLVLNADVIHTADYANLLAFHALSFLSALAALVYLVCWIRSWSLLFGSDTYAQATVLSVLMLGFAVGSYGCGRLVRRTERPLLWYGAVELGIGVSALCVAPALAALLGVSSSIYNAFLETPVVFIGLRALLGFVVLLLPTVLMGATLPLLMRSCAAACRSRRSRRGRPRSRASSAPRPPIGSAPRATSRWSYPGRQACRGSARAGGRRSPRAPFSAGSRRPS